MLTMHASLTVVHLIQYDLCYCVVSVLHCLSYSHYLVSFNDVLGDG